VSPVTGWRAVLLAPIAIPLAILAGLFSKPKRRTPAEVARYLRNFIDDVGGEWDWDDFESVPIADPTLDRIRTEAGRAAPPNLDMDRLRALLAEAESLARQTPA
jgi:hypothetical protein